jgi:hypothetical protein
MSPFDSLANKGPAAGRSTTGTEPLTPSSTTIPSMTRPCNVGIAFDLATLNVEALAFSKLTGAVENG